MIEMKIDLGRGVILKNPIMTASGTFGYGLEFEQIFDLSLIGGIVTKAITVEKRIGNDIPRICETDYGMINSIGLANPGLDYFLANIAPKLRNLNTNIFINVAGRDIAEYVKVASALDKLDFISGLEINISCPNVKKGGIAFGADPFVAAKVTSEIRKITKKHLMIKLSPNVTDITNIAKACEDSGADSLSLINTLLGMAINTKTFRPKIKQIVGGYSGPAIKPIALEKVYKCSQKVKIPLIGMGGIKTVNDVVEFLLAGASAVQVGTINFTQPNMAKLLVEELEIYLQKKNIKNIKELISGMLL